MEQDNTLLNEELNNTSEVPANETESNVPEQLSSETAESPDKPEIPNVDFTLLSTQEIVSELQKLIEQYAPGQIKTDHLPDIFEKQYQKEFDQALADFTADGTPATDFKYKNDAKEKFYNLCKSLKDKKVAMAKQTEAEREKNLEIKLQLIEELKELVQKEEALNKTFQEFKDIQERWRNTGLVPQGQVNNLLETYHHHVENFYNYIKINKELRDLDLKKNLDAKIKLCEEAEQLIEKNDINEAFKQLQFCMPNGKRSVRSPKNSKNLSGSVLKRPPAKSMKATTIFSRP